MLPVPINLSVFQILHQNFIQKYPFVNHSNKLFTFKHNTGQPFSDWVKQLHAIGDEYELD